MRVVSPELAIRRPSERPGLISDGIAARHALAALRYARLDAHFPFAAGTGNGIGLTDHSPVVAFSSTLAEMH
jgi:hypothetical protein